jgi:hypothetical protein
LKLKFALANFVIVDSVVATSANVMVKILGLEKKKPLPYHCTKITHGNNLCANL